MYHKLAAKWLHYEDDTFTAEHKYKIDAFHEHLDEQLNGWSLRKLLYITCLHKTRSKEL